MIAVVLHCSYVLDCISGNACCVETADVLYGVRKSSLRSGAGEVTCSLQLMEWK